MGWKEMVGRCGGEGKREGLIFRGWIFVVEKLRIFLELLLYEQFVQLLQVN